MIRLLRSCVLLFIGALILPGQAMIRNARAAGLRAYVWEHKDKWTERKGIAAAHLEAAGFEVILASDAEASVAKLMERAYSRERIVLAAMDSSPGGGQLTDEPVAGMMTNPTSHHNRSRSTPCHPSMICSTSSGPTTSR